MTVGVPLDAVTVVTEEVRELVRRTGIDPAREPEQVRRLVDEVVAEYDERVLTSGLPPLHDRRGTARVVCDLVAGLGPLQRYLDDPLVEEIWVNDPPTHASVRTQQSVATQLTQLMPNGLPPDL